MPVPYPVPDKPPVQAVHCTGALTLKYLEGPDIINIEFYKIKKLVLVKCIFCFF